MRAMRRNVMRRARAGFAVAMLPIIVGEQDRCVSKDRSGPWMEKFVELID